MNKEKNQVAPEICEAPKVIDLSHKITKNIPVSEFDDPVLLEKSRDLKKDYYNDCKLTTGMHVGTHIDGPGHLTESTILLSDIPVDKFIGRGHLIDARNKPIDEDLFKDLLLQEAQGELEGAIILILTGYDKKFGQKVGSKEYKEYFDGHPVIPVSLAKALVKYKIKMVGIDFFSPDKYPFDTHKVFLENNILIIENLTNLESLIGVKDFTVVALPIKIETDSALGRVIAIVD